MSERLDYLARRVANDPFFLASALADYARSESLDDAGLARFLGCTPAALIPLRLCRRPDGAAATFREEIALIAARCGVDRTALNALIRRVEAVDALRFGGGTAAATPGLGMLLAARDRDGADQGDDEALVADEEKERP